MKSPLKKIKEKIQGAANKTDQAQEVEMPEPEETETTDVKLEDPQQQPGAAAPQPPISEVIGLAETARITLLQEILAELKGMRKDLKAMDGGA